VEDPNGGRNVSCKYRGLALKIKEAECVEALPPVRGWMLRACFTEVQDVAFGRSVSVSYF